MSSINTELSPIGSSGPLTMLADLESVRDSTPLVAGEGSTKVKHPADIKMFDFLSEYYLDPSRPKQILAYLDEIGYGPSVDDAKVLEGLAHFSGDHGFSHAWQRNFNWAVEHFWSVYGTSKLHPYYFHSMEDIWEAFPKQHAHAGYVELELGIHGKRAVTEALGFKAITQFLSDTSSTKRIDIPYVIVRRVTPKGAFDANGKPTFEADAKNRVIWVQDVRAIIAEMMFSIPVMQFMVDQPWYAPGKSKSDIQKRINTERQHYSRWLSLDYSQYDATLPNWLIKASFSVLRQLFPSFTPYEQGLWEAVVSHFIDKEWLFKKERGHVVHGVPSGSMFTNVIDSIANRLILMTFMHACYPSDSFSTLVCGDDNLVFTNADIDLVQLARYVKSVFNVVVNVDKTDKGTSRMDPHFLSRFWTRFGTDRSEWEIVCKLLFPESRRTYRDSRDLFLLIFGYAHEFYFGIMRILDWRRILADAYRLGVVFDPYGEFNADTGSSRLRQSIRRVEKLKR